MEPTVAKAHRTS